MDQVNRCCCHSEREEGTRDEQSIFGVDGDD